MNNDFKIEFQKGSRIQQIERSSVILANIFTLLRSSAEFPTDAEKFQDETVSLSEIGEAFVYSIYENISHFIEPDEERQMDTNELLNVSEFIEPDETPVVVDAESESLARELSKILNNPSLPITLYNALQEGITNVYNKGDGDRLNRLESSPEYLLAVIEASREHES